MPLTVTAINAAKPKDKPYKLADGTGLYRLVMPNGGRLWRMNYPFDGKQRTIAFGNYPDRSLAKARERRTQTREALAEGIADCTYHDDANKRQDPEKCGHISAGAIGCFDNDVYLYLCDRARGMIISGGVNIYPAEIEAELPKMEQPDLRYYGERGRFRADHHDLLPEDLMAQRRPAIWNRIADAGSHPAPLMGQDTFAVLRDWLHVNDIELARLAATGTIETVSPKIRDMVASGSYKATA